MRKFSRNDEAIRKLSPEQYRVTQQNGTEAPGTGLHGEAVEVIFDPARNPKGIWSRGAHRDGGGNHGPRGFHNGPRYSGLLAALGFATLVLLSDVAK